MKKEVATKVTRALSEFSAPIDALTAISDELETVEEGRQMRRHPGAIMVAIDEIMRPTIQRYLDLDPDRDPD